MEFQIFDILKEQILTPDSYLGFCEYVELLGSTSPPDGKGHCRPYNFDFMVCILSIKAVFSCSLITKGSPQ